MELPSIFYPGQLMDKCTICTVVIERRCYVKNTARFKPLVFLLLKGSLTRDIRLHVFFMNQCPPGPPSIPLEPNFFENSRRYSRINVYHRCQPVLRIRIRDPGSGAFLTPGSEIRNRFFPDPGSRIPDPKPIPSNRVMSSQSGNVVTCTINFLCGIALLFMKI